MAKRSKRARANQEIAAKLAQPLPLPEAVKAVKQFKGPAFDETIEAHLHLGIDPRQADQQLRGAVALPHGVGRTNRVIAFCQTDKVEEAKQAGAVEAGGEDLVEKIEKGWMEFDVAVASPDMMKTVSRLGKVLGPKGLMPSPKAGTVTPDVVTAVQEYTAGKVEYRNDHGGNLHVPIGKRSFSDDQLAENLDHFLKTVQRIKPASAKGTYIRKCVVAGSMTPAVEVAV